MWRGDITVPILPTRPLVWTWRIFRTSGMAMVIETADITKTTDREIGTRCSSIRRRRRYRNMQGRRGRQGGDLTPTNVVSKPIDGIWKPVLTHQHYAPITYQCFHYFPLYQVQLVQLAWPLIDQLLLIISIRPSRQEKHRGIKISTVGTKWKVGPWYCQYAHNLTS